MDGYGPWVDAFWELDTDRDFAAEKAPIPNRSIIDWGVHNRFDRDEAALFRAMIREMDDVYRNGDRGKEPVKPLSADTFDAMFGG